MTRRQAHGLTYDQAAVFRSGKPCALCGAPEVTGSGGHCVDHDHKTMKIRGVLCRGCNNRLSYLENYPEWLGQALAYLALERP